MQCTEEARAGRCCRMVDESPPATLTRTPTVYDRRGQDFDKHAAYVVAARLAPDPRSPIRNARSSPSILSPQRDTEHSARVARVVSRGGPRGLLGHPEWRLLLPVGRPPLGRLTAGCRIRPGRCGPGSTSPGGTWCAYCLARRRRHRIVDLRDRVQRPLNSLQVVRLVGLVEC